MLPLVEDWWFGGTITAPDGTTGVHPEYAEPWVGVPGQSGATPIDCIDAVLESGVYSYGSVVSVSDTVSQCNAAKLCGASLLHRMDAFTPTDDMNIQYGFRCTEAAVLPITCLEPSCSAPDRACTLLQVSKPACKEWRTDFLNTATYPTIVYADDYAAAGAAWEAGFANVTDPGGATVELQRAGAYQAVSTKCDMISTPVSLRDECEECSRTCMHARSFTLQEGFNVGSELLIVVSLPPSAAPAPKLVLSDTAHVYSRTLSRWRPWGTTSACWSRSTSHARCCSAPRLSKA